MARLKLTPSESSLLSVIRLAPALPAALQRAALGVARAEDDFGSAVLGVLLRRHEIPLNVLQPLCPTLDAATPLHVLLPYLNRPEHTGRHLRALCGSLPADITRKVASSPILSARAAGALIATSPEPEVLENLIWNTHLPAEVRAHALAQFVAGAADPMTAQKELKDSRSNCFHHRDPLTNAAAGVVTHPDLVRHLAWAVSTAEAAVALAETVRCWPADLLATSAASDAAMNVAATLASLADPAVCHGYASWLESQARVLADDTRDDLVWRLTQLRAEDNMDLQWDDPALRRNWGSFDGGVELAAYVTGSLGDDVDAWAALLSVGRNFTGSPRQLVSCVKGATAA